MAWQTAAGAVLRIGTGVPATFDAAGYAAITYTEVGEITNIGSFGKEYALVSHQPLSSRGVKKGKGSFNNGTLNPALAYDSSDEGQIALKAALDSDSAFPFQVELQDGSSFYMMAIVMSLKPNVGGVDEVVTSSPTLEVTSDPIIEVAA